MNTILNACLLNSKTRTSVRLKISNFKESSNIEYSYKVKVMQLIGRYWIFPHIFSLHTPRKAPPGDPGEGKGVQLG